MSSEQIAIRAKGISKCFELYDTPRDRLKQLIAPRMQELFGWEKKQYFQEFWALNNISFEMKKGETIGIVGRNGSGKSTLLQIICGTLTASTGSVESYGRISALLELGSGFSPDFTGRENVYMNAAIFGLTEAEIDERLDDILEFADIGQFIDQPVKAYSTGMMMRLAFAVAINVEPQILIIDEALAVGDELFQRKCFSKIQALKDDGATILFVSHSGGAIIELCDRAILLHSGELLLADTPKKVVDKYQRLLHGTKQQQQELLEDIRKLNDSVDVDHQPSESLVEVAKHDFFDFSLKSQSVLEYESKGAVIKSVQIIDLEGNSINILRRGQEYVCRYNIHFDKSAYAVRAGFLLKTVSGFELGGMQSHSVKDSLQYVAAGKTLQFSFKFKCHLLPGVYFFNTGVVANVDGLEVYLHRIIDAFTFRVANESDLPRTAIIDFGASNNSTECIGIVDISADIETF